MKENSLKLRGHNNMPKVTKKTKKFTPRIKGEIEKRKIIKKDRKREQKKLSKRPQNEESSENEDQNEIDLVAQHKKEMAELRETQKEFMEFLEKEDAPELYFGANEDESGQDEPDEEEEAPEEEPEEEIPQENIVTAEILNKWKSKAHNQIPCLRKLVGAFRLACHLNDPDEGKPGDLEAELQSRHRIVSSAVFNDIMLYALKEIPGLFDIHLKLNEQKPDDDEEVGSEGKIPPLPNKFPTRWKRVSLIVKSFLTSTVHFLNGLTEEKMLTFVLRQTEKWVHYFGPFPVLSMKFLKKVLDLWGSSTESVRLMAFFNLRKLAINLPYPFIDNILKGSYLTYVRNSKFHNPKTAALTTFMSNCLIELYALDFPASYQHAFVYIRQIAIHLRNAIQDKTKVIHGVIAVSPVPRHYPVRCHCIRMLNELAAARPHTKGIDQPVFVNSAVYVLEMLEYAPFFKPRVAYSGKPIDFSDMLSGAPKILPTKGYTDAIIFEVHSLLTNYFSIYSNSIAFPELVVPALVQLKHFIKKSKNVQYNNTLRNLADALQTNANFITAKRNSLSFGPADKQRTLAFSVPITKNPMLTYKKEQDTIAAMKRKPLEAQKEKEEEEVEHMDEEKPETDGSGVSEDESSMGIMDNDEYEGGEGDLVEDFNFDDLSGDEISDDEDDDE